MPRIVKVAGVYSKRAILVVVPALSIMASKTISMIGDSNERQISATLPRVMISLRE
jgi:hypothetical protein